MTWEKSPVVDVWLYRVGAYTYGSVTRKRSKYVAIYYDGRSWQNTKPHTFPKLKRAQEAVETAAKLSLAVAALRAG